eukprot:TRINITY_DN17542_c0_g2_i3.p1 TRINITY_DN17542_c0_g2~~TRINITY_DN17542_c0_g2_i3.p1  ORF type:complete len:3545 (+),score=591.11 TRINITY_DN17542_c0_g2_i3:81-10715(+)
MLRELLLAACVINALSQCSSQMSENDCHKQACYWDTGYGECLECDDARSAGGWRQFKNKEYQIFMGTRLNWVNANNDCISKGGILAQIPDEATYTYIKKYLNRVFDKTSIDIWINLVDTSNGGYNFEMATGSCTSAGSCASTPNTFFRTAYPTVAGDIWGSSEPNGNNFGCARLKSSGYPLFELFDWVCNGGDSNDRFWYVCERPVSASTWFSAASDKEMKLFYGNDKSATSCAQQACKTAGGNLATFRNAGEESAATTEMDSLGETEAIIGLQKVGRSGLYSWFSEAGFPVTGGGSPYYKNFIPSLSSDDKNWVGVLKKSPPDFRWSMEIESYVSSFMCERITTQATATDGTCSLRLGLNADDVILNLAFDENTGMSTTSSEGALAGIPAALNTGVSWSTGKFGSCLEFDDGASQPLDQVALPSYLHSRSGYPTGDFTVSFWIYPDSDFFGSSTGRIVISIGFYYTNTWDTNTGWVVMGKSSGMQLCGSGSTSHCTTIAYDSNWVDKWTHFTFVRDAAAQSITAYVNGATATVSTTGTIPRNYYFNLAPIGGYSQVGGSRDWNDDSPEMKLDDLMLFRVVIPNGRISDLMNNCKETCVSTFDEAMHNVDPIDESTCLTEGSTCPTLSCVTGFTGSPTVVCSPGDVWTVSGTACTEITCAKNDLNWASLNMQDPDVTPCDTFNEAACTMLSCAAGYAGSVDISCTAPATWTVSGACTVVVCPAFAFATHNIDPASDLTGCDTTIEPQCFPNCQNMYEAASGAVSVQCIKNPMDVGQWVVGNSCTPITCTPAWTDHAALFMKALDSTPCSRMIDSPCSLTCEDGYQPGFFPPELRCRATGWQVSGDCEEIVCSVGTFDFATNKIVAVTQAALSTCDGTTEQATPCSLNCEPGRTGSPTLHCDNSGNWVVGGVVCAPTPCNVAGFNKTIHNSDDPPDFTVCNEVGKPACPITCATGYEAVAMLPTPSLTCATGGVWQFGGQCDPILCTAPFDFASNNVDALTAMELDACDGVPDPSCPLVCESGYTGGSLELLCSGSPAAWSTTGSPCTPVVCSAATFDPNVGPYTPLTMAYMSSTCANTAMGSCDLVCATNYVGTGSLTCSNTGNYVVSGAGCTVVQCTTPFVPATYNVLSVVTTANDEATDPPIALTCESNYVGTPSLQCNSSGNWEVTGSCTSVTCDTLLFDPAVHNAKAVVSFAACATSVDGHCALACIDTHEGTPDLKCLVSGAWDVTGSACVPKTCSSPFTPATYDVDPLSTTPCEKATDSPCSLTCIAGYQGSPSLSCSTSSSWDVTGTPCTPIQCDILMFNPMMYNVNPIMAPAIDACDHSTDGSCPLVCAASFSGSASLECDMTGQWVVTGSCGALTCIPASFNAAANFVQSPASFAPCDDVLETACAMTCLTNYVGSPSLKCVDNSGTPEWQVQGTACAPMQCDTSMIDVTVNNAIQPTAAEFTACDEATESGCSLVCATNYQGSSTLTCTDNAGSPTWDFTGSCNPVSCSTALFDHASNNVQDLLVKGPCDDATKMPCDLTCLAGYQGSAKLQCSSSGSWTVTGTPCTASTCASPFDAAMHNVDAPVTTTSCDTVPEGSCTLTCITGYEGSPELECVGSGSWQVNNPCTAVTCTLASLDTAGNNLMPVTDVSACDEVLEPTCLVSCTAMFMGSPEIHCTHKDVWEVKNPCGTILCDHSQLDLVTNFLSAAPSNIADCDEVSEGTCTASCATGYTGSPLVKCISKDTFDIQGTACTPITCSLASFDHATNFINAPVTIDACNTVPEGTCTVSCLSGYEGSPLIKCTATDTWDVQGTPCAPKKCDVSLIDFLAMDTEAMDATGVAGCDEVPEGTCSLTCLPGYTGSPTAECVNTDVWSFGGTPCAPIKCSLASLNAASHFMATPAITACDEVTKGTCTVGCITGYSGAPVINCTSLNNWDVSGVCSPIACDVATLDTATAFIATQMASDVVNCNQVIKGTCSPACQLGYSGSPLIQCVAADQWSITGTSCSPITCSEASFDKALYFVHSIPSISTCDTVPEGTCTGVCEDGYEGSPDIECIALDTWSVTGTSCETIKCSHASLAGVAGANEVQMPSSADLLNCDEVIESSGCSAACNIGYKGTPTVKCTATDTWEVVSTCDVIYCALSDLDPTMYNIIKPTDITICETVPQGRCPIQCDPDYSGTPELRCIDPGAWDVIGSCQPIKCNSGFDFGANNIQFTADLSLCNEKRLGECSLQCSDGYKGSPKLACSGPDTWELIDPCEEVMCSTPFDAASHNIKSPTSLELAVCDSVPEGDCTPSCLDGYEGSPLLSCDAQDSWSVRGVPCTPITCTFASFDADLNNIDKSALMSQSDVDKCDTVPKGSCRVQCNSEFVGNPKLMCVGKDTWEVHPQCTPKECSVNFVDASFNLEPLSSSMVANCNQVVKAACYPQCAPGYTGNSALKCVDQDKWEEQGTPCTPITCDSANFNPSFYNVEALSVFASCDTVPEGSCDLTCSKGYKGNPKLECTGTGQWSVSNNCEIWTCDKTFDAAANFIKAGSVVTSSCNDEFKTPCSAECIIDYSGSPTVACENGEFKVQNKCESIKCGTTFDFATNNIRSTTLTSCDEAHEGSCPVTCAPGYSYGGSPTTAEIQCVKVSVSPPSAKFVLNGPTCFESCSVPRIEGATSNCSSSVAIHSTHCNWVSREGYTCLDIGNSVCNDGSFSLTPTCSKSCLVPTITGADSSCTEKYANNGITCSWTATSNYTCPMPASAVCRDGQFSELPKCDRKCLIPEVKGSYGANCIVGQSVSTGHECAWLPRPGFTCKIPSDPACRDGVLEVPTCNTNCLLPYPWIPNIDAADCPASDAAEVQSGKTCTWVNLKKDAQDCINLGAATCRDGNFTRVPVCQVRQTDVPPTAIPPTDIPATPAPPTPAPPTPEPVPLELVMISPLEPTPESVLQKGKVRIVLGLRGATWLTDAPRNVKIASIRPSDTQFWITREEKEIAEKKGIIETAPLGVPPKVISVTSDKVTLEIGPLEDMNVFSDESLVVSAVVSNMNRYTTQNVPDSEGSFIQASAPVKIQAESQVSDEERETVTTSAAATASQAGRTIMLLKLLDCPYKFDDDQLSFAENPTGLTVGSWAKFPHRTGAFLGNILLISCILATHAIIAYLIYFFRKNDTKTHTFQGAMGMARFPNYCFLPAMFFYQISLESSLGVLFYDPYAASKVLALGSIIVLNGSVAAFIIYPTTPNVFVVAKNAKFFYWPESKSIWAKLRNFIFGPGDYFSARDTSFVWRCGLVFQDFWPKYHKFMIAELVFVSILSLVDAIEANSVAQCRAQLWVILIMYLIFTSLLLKTRPYHANINNISSIGSAGFQTATVALILAHLYSEAPEETDWMIETAKVCLYLSIIMFLTKTTVDILNVFYDNWESWRTQGAIVAKGERIAKLQQENEMKRINANAELHALPTIEETEGLAVFEEMEVNSSEPTTPLPLDSSDSQFRYGDPLRETQMIPISASQSSKSRWFSQRDLSNTSKQGASKWVRSRNSKTPIGRASRLGSTRGRGDRGDASTPLIDFAA